MPESESPSSASWHLVDNELSVAEWTTLRDLLSRAAAKVRHEVRDSSPEYRSTIDLSLGNVEHVIACEIAHATGQPCPLHKAVQP